MLLLCDLDDTVLSRRAAFARWLEQFAAARGLGAEDRAWLVEIDADGYRRRPEFFSLVRDRLDLPNSIESLLGQFYGVFALLFECDAEVRAALERARTAGWKIAIVTNGSPAQEGKILATGLDRLVDTWCISEVEGYRKPDVRLLDIAARRCGVPLERAWMIGDNGECDIGAAVAAGIPSVWIGERRPWPLVEFSPTYEAASFAEAVDLALAGCQSARRPEETDGGGDAGAPVAAPQLGAT